MGSCLTGGDGWVAGRVFSQTRAVIQRIKENLGDRYRSGFPILRELIQNADDAGATRVDLGGLPV